MATPLERREREIRARILRELGELYADEYTRTQFKRFDFPDDGGEIAERVMRTLSRHLLIEHREPGLARLTPAGYRLLREADDTSVLPPATRPTPEEMERLSQEVGGADYFSQSRIVDGQVKLQWATDGFRRVTGYSPDEIDRIGGWPVVLCAPQDAAPIFDLLSAGEKARGELEFIKRSREIGRLRYAVWPRMHGGRLIGTIAAGKDVTPPSSRPDHQP